MKGVSGNRKSLTSSGALQNRALGSQSILKNIPQKRKKLIDTDIRKKSRAVASRTEGLREQKKKCCALGSTVIS